MKISHIVARQILDSRGNPTVEADVWLESGVFGRAAVPSGASTGSHEAYELRDGNETYGGKSVLSAVANIEGEILEAIKNVPVDDQYKIDQTMIDLDGTPNKKRLGANAILAVSLACAKAAAAQRGVTLYKHINDIAHNPKMSIPMPMMNVLNGGQHASNSSDFQEFMIIPLLADSYAKAVQIGSEVFHSLQKGIAKLGGTTTVGDEGGFTYQVESNTEMLELLSHATKAAGYEPGRDVVYALDIAASEFFVVEEDGYELATEDRILSRSEMIEYIDDITRDYPVVSVEDGLDQDEWDAWEELTRIMGEDVQLVGDDLLVTNTKHLQHAIDSKAGNAILIKPNQIGTLSETIKTIQLAKDNGWRTVVSHRSGETEDTTIAHLAVGTGAGQIKTGSLSRGERTAKHNELMRIESLDSSLSISNPFI